VKRGKPTLCPWQEVRDKQIGVEGHTEGQTKGQQKAHGSQEAAAAAAALLGEAGGSFPVEVEHASAARHAVPNSVPPPKNALPSQPAK
jgi:hypothetical protein